MTRYALLAAVPALAVCAPAFAQMHPAAPYDPNGEAAEAPVMTQAPPITVRTDPATGAVIETVTLPPGTRPPPPGEGDGRMALTDTPHFVWVPGHYDWDPTQNKYVWLVGQYLQAPHERARWVDGRWQREPDNTVVWIDGHFR